MLKRGLKSRLFRVLFLAGSVAVLGIFPVMTSAWAQTAPLEAPSNLTATALSFHDIRLNWQRNNSTFISNPRGNLMFMIEFRTGTTGYSPSASGPVDTLHVDALRPNTTYYFRVRAARYDSSTVTYYDYSSYSNEAYARTAPFVGPHSLTATAVSSNQINLAWRGDANRGWGFEIERSTAATPKWELIAVLNADRFATTYSDSGLSPGNTYSYRVRTVDANRYFFQGSFIYTPYIEASARTLETIPAPGQLTATAVSSSQIDLRWQDNSNNEREFKIERKTGATGTFSQIATAPANATTYQSTGLSPDTTYSYRVRASNSGGDSPFSNEPSTTTLPTIPTAPGQLTATAVSSSQIDLRWQDNSNNEREFKIERKTGTAGTFSQIATAPANATTYQGTGLSPHTTYSYRVRAYNAAGDSPYSNESSARTAPPTPPSDLTAIAASPSEIRLTWQDNSNDEAGFKIERSTGASGSWSQIATVGAANSGYHGYRDAGLNPNTTYSYRVRAYNAVGDSAYSNAFSATTIPSAPPAAPSILSATLAALNRINVTWRANSTDATGFRIERRTGAAGSWSRIAIVGAGITAYDDSSLTPNNTYYYRVQAYNSAGDSSYSNEASAFAMAPPRAPSNLIATALASSKIGLTWQDNADKSADFRIERKTGVGGSWSEIDKVGRGIATYPDSGLSPNTIYYYRVRAFNPSVGYSPYSNEAKATTPMR